MRKGSDRDLQLLGALAGYDRLNLQGECSGFAVPTARGNPDLCERASMSKRSLSVQFSESPTLTRFGAWCLDLEDHQQTIIDLTRGLDPYGDPASTVRALPDPGSWVVVGGSFVRVFPCGCLLSVHL